MERIKAFKAKREHEEREKEKQNTVEHKNRSERPRGRMSKWDSPSAPPIPAVTAVAIPFAQPAATPASQVAAATPESESDNAKNFIKAKIAEEMASHHDKMTKLTLLGPSANTMQMMQLQIKLHEEAMNRLRAQEKQLFAILAGVPAQAPAVLPAVGPPQAPSQQQHHQQPPLSQHPQTDEEWKIWGERMVSASPQAGWTAAQWEKFGRDKLNAIKLKPMSVASDGGSDGFAGTVATAPDSQDYVSSNDSSGRKWNRDRGAGDGGSGREWTENSDWGRAGTGKELTEWTKKEEVKKWRNTSPTPCDRSRSRSRRRSPSHSHRRSSSRRSRRHRSHRRSRSRSRG